jgi:hypothetical protein
VTQINPDANHGTQFEGDDLESLLQPDHIEPSPFEPSTEAPRPAELTEPEPTVPMADFAAAAQILRQRQERDKAEAERPRER